MSDDLVAKLRLVRKHAKYEYAKDEFLMIGMVMRDAADEIERLRDSLRECVATIDDYLAYRHDGDPWSEDARAMGEMDINQFQHDGRLARAKALVTALEQTP